MKEGKVRDALEKILLAPQLGLVVLLGAVVEAIVINSEDEEELQVAAAVDEAVRRVASEIAKRRSN